MDLPNPRLRMIARYRVGVTDYVKPPFELEREELGSEFEIVPITIGALGEVPTEQLASLDALLVWHTTITHKWAKALVNAKIVVRYGVGYDNVDVESLEQQKIVFCNTPDYGVEEVADTSVAMILSLHRRIFEYNADCRQLQSRWQHQTRSPLLRASSTTIGIIGVGRIGSSVIRRLSPFGYKLIGYDPYQPAGHEKAVGYYRVEHLDDVIERSDIITLHCPLTPETKGMVDERFLSKVRRNVILVNTARGQLVANLDLIYAALLEGRLHSVGFDVLPEEPPLEGKLINAWLTQNGPLEGRIILNPHAAYFSEQAWIEMRTKAARTIRRFLVEEVTVNRIRPGGAMS
jgi:phosphoglycerate dehydrogenase-like enzyme